MENITLNKEIKDKINEEQASSTNKIENFQINKKSSIYKNTELPNEHNTKFGIIDQEKLTKNDKNNSLENETNSSQIISPIINSFKSAKTYFVNFIKEIIYKPKARVLINPPKGITAKVIIRNQNKCSNEDEKIINQNNEKNKIEINEIIQPEFNSSNRLRKIDNECELNKNEKIGNQRRDQINENSEQTLNNFTRNKSYSLRRTREFNYKDNCSLPFISIEKQIYDQIIYLLNEINCDYNSTTRRNMIDNELITIIFNYINNYKNSGKILLELLKCIQKDCDFKNNREIEIERKNSNKQEENIIASVEIISNNLDSNVKEIIFELEKFEPFKSSLNIEIKMGKKYINDYRKNCFNKIRTKNNNKRRK